jgi:tetratricopeptide (TPR) repeat protein
VYEKRFQQQAVRLKQLVKTKNSNALDQLKQLMAHYPPNGRLIVLFDNCEGLQKGVNGAIEPANLNEFLKYICVNAPQGCHVLFTTRYRLTEWETEVVHFALDCLTIEEQNQFLDFSPVLRKIPEIERPALYERFQGHPQSYTQLESLMERDKEFHWQRVAEATQVVVFNNLLLQNIYERLLKTEQRFFQQMVLCITHTPYEVLAHLVQQPVEWVEKELKLLENWALCMLDEPAKRFVVHPLVREWMHQQVVSKDFLSNGYIVLGTYFSDNISDINNLNLQNALLSKKYFELAGENGILGFAETALCLQNYFQKIGEYARAVELNDAVLKLNVNRLIQSDALNNLGMIAYFKLEHSESEKHFRASLALRILENNQIRIAESYHNIATLYQDQQLYDEAKAFFNDSLTIKRALSAATAIHPERITLHLTLNNLSQISAAQGDLTEALHYLNESLIIAKKEQDSSAQCTTSMNIADIYLKKEDFDNALKYFSEAEALIDQEALSTDSITLFLNISQLYALRENYTGALEYVLRAFRLARRHSLKENEIRHQLGRILHEAGRQTLEKLVKNL